VLEQATQGLPGRWSICLAENEEESPWPPFAADGGQPAGTSAVSATLLRACEFVDNRHAPDPEHAQMLADAGADLRRAGKNGLRGIARFADPDTSADQDFSRILPSPRHVPHRRGRRPQRRDLDGGPGVRRVVRHRHPRRTAHRRRGSHLMDTERAVALRSALAAAGYLLDIAEEGARIRITISVTPQARAGCLVPKDLMRGILGQALGVPEDAIDLTYPLDPTPER